MAKFMTQLSIRLSQEEHEALSVYAAREGCTPTGLITEWVRRGIKNVSEDKNGKKPKVSGK